VTASDPAPVQELQGATPVLLQGNLLTVEQDFPLPPGTRVTVPLPRAAALQSLPSGKVVSVRRGKERRIQLTIRLHSLSNKQRDALTRAMAGNEPPTPGRD
jgi:hypothetical protein